MIAFYPLLLTAAHWQAARGWLERRGWLRPHVVLPAPEPPRSARTVLRELAVAALCACVALEVLNDNADVPKALRVPQPAWAKAVIEYPRLYQGWRMFAPTPPLTDTMLYVDALTSEGSHVDPYNEVASRTPFPAGPVVPPRLDQSQFFTMYSDRIPYADYAAYRQAFLEWLLAYPQRTGRKQDCLVRFDAYWIEDRTAALRERSGPVAQKREKFLEYVAPVDGDCKVKPAREQPQLVQTVPH
jgi:hypothetical protein